MTKITVFRKSHRLSCQCEKNFLTDTLVIIGDYRFNLFKTIYSGQLAGEFNYVSGIVVNQKFCQKRTAVILIFPKNFFRRFLCIVKKSGGKEPKNRLGLGFFIRRKFRHLILSDLSRRHTCIDHDRRLFANRTTCLNGFDLCADRSLFASDRALDLNALHRRFRAFCYGDYSRDPRFQISIKCLFPCVEALSSSKHFRQFGGTHSVISNNQRPVYFQTFPHPLQETCPLVFHPDRLKIFGLTAVNNHHRSRVQRIVDIRLVFVPRLIPQSFPTEKNAVSFPGKISIEVGNFNAVIRTLNVVLLIGILEAKEHIICWLFACFFIPFDPVLFNDFPLFLIVCSHFGIRCTGKGGKVFLVAEEGLHRGCIAGRQFTTVIVVLVFDSIAGKDKPPMRFGIFRILFYNIRVKFFGIIKTCQSQLL